MIDLHFDAPINSLSFGNVAFNFLREMHKKGVAVSFFPQGKKADFTAFDKADEDLLKWITDCANNRYMTLSATAPTLKLWHINGAENRVAPDQYLFTFYECDTPTEEEVNIVKAQKQVFFSSTEACNLFKEKGCDNVSFAPLGFDPDLYKTGKEYLGKDVIHFGLVGKLEKRKNTQEIIQTWLEKYGNDPKYQLTCLINNQFFEEDQFKKIIEHTTGGKRWTNLNLLPHLTTNSEVNELINAIDIDLSGCNANEGWNLPSFNSACMGNICIVGQGMAHKDWAHGENIVSIEPKSKQKCYDNTFFREGLPFNQGNFYVITKEQIAESMDKAVEKLLLHREKYDRSDLIEKFSYENSVNTILNMMI
ncbi:hypothetical protein N9955_00895 [bacterium]|nr:hypothetical protein [bacterium]